MDNKFLKSEILPFSSADENAIKQAYKRVSLDVMEVILREKHISNEKNKNKKDGFIYRLFCK